MSACGPVRKREEGIPRFACVRDQEHLSPQPASLRSTKRSFCLKWGSRGEGCYGGGSRSQRVVPGDRRYLTHHERAQSFPVHSDQCSLGAARVLIVRRSVGTGEHRTLEHEAVSADLLETKRTLCPESMVAQHIGDLWWIWGMFRSIWGQEVISSPSRRAAPRQEQAFGTRREQAKWDTHGHRGGVLGQQVGNEAPPSLEPAGQPRGSGEEARVTPGSMGRL